MAVPTELIVSPSAVQVLPGVDTQAVSSTPATTSPSTSKHVLPVPVDCTVTVAAFSCKAVASAFSVPSAVKSTSLPCKFTLPAGPTALKLTSAALSAITPELDQFWPSTPSQVPWSTPVTTSLFASRHVPADATHVWPDTPTHAASSAA